MTEQQLFDQLLEQRGLTGEARRRFLAADYAEVTALDPFLLPDMAVAVQRLVMAQRQRQTVLVYGDYDADGVTATALLVDALRHLGFAKVNYFIPDRFSDGYGLNKSRIEYLAKQFQPALIVTVDCGSLNHDEVLMAQRLGIDVIITDHHNLGETYPKALALINPKRADSKFPIQNMAGVAVAFNLVRALQTKLDNLKPGQEKWLLDLVAIGTITDLIELKDYNRVLVKYGLLVLAKTRRIGLKALLELVKLSKDKIDAEAIGFILGPRFNAAGRLETANLVLDLLLADDLALARQKAERLEFLNQKRRALQDLVFSQARTIAEQDSNPVLVLRQTDWHEGVVGIVASKLMELYHKPTFVLSEKNGLLKGSARSFGGFSVFEALKSSHDYFLKGGGHQAAGGVQLRSEQFENFRSALNRYYRSLDLSGQEQFWQYQADIELNHLSLLNQKFYKLFQSLAPFGVGNPEPIFKLVDMTVEAQWRLGRDNEHLKLKLGDVAGSHIMVVTFGDGQNYQLQLGDKVTVLIKISLNEWQGKSSIEGRLLELIPQ